jgi:6-pyruvoyl-tetrahydropterin synthase
MIIRKEFKFEGGHAVRNSGYTTRCSQNQHGHSFKVEVFLKSDTLDAGCMVTDFGLIKHYINDFIDPKNENYFNQYKIVKGYPMLKLNISAGLNLEIDISKRFYS